MYKTLNAKTAVLAILVTGFSIAVVYVAHEKYTGKKKDEGCK